MTISLRLDDLLANRLGAAAKAREISRSELIRECLREYLTGDGHKPTAWELGKHLFGCYESGRGDLSEWSEEIVRERIHGRFNPPQS